MKRRNLTFALIIMVVMLISGCGAAASEVPPDMLRMDHETGYFPLPDDNANKIKVIRTGLKDSNFCAFTESSDAMFLLFWHDEGDAGKIEDFVPAVRKYDARGKLLWEKQYDIRNMKGASACLEAYQGGFVLSLEKWPDYSASSNDNNCHLLRCDGEGQILWHQKSGSSTGEKIKKLFVTEQHEILTVGVLQGQFGSEGEHRDIGITKWDADGKVRSEQRYGGKDYETLLSAGFADGLGLVVSLQTQSYPDLHHIIVCFDGNLQEKWSYKPDNTEIFSWENLLVTGDSVYQTGWLVSDGNENKGFMVKLDREGKVVFRDVGDRLYQALAVLKDGNLAVSGVMGSRENPPATGMQKHFLSVISPDHQALFEEVTGNDPFFSEITPLSDGGFITLTRRNIKTIPQPLYVSSIWYDTEKVAARYDQSMKLVWRKTYNRYKDVLDTDLVYATKDGWLVVE